MIFRCCDLVLSISGLVLAFPLLLIVYVLGLFDTRQPLFFQERVGQNQQPFTLIKFRTMQLETASVATHLADASSVTKLGKVLRASKLDELPQLWNVLKGEMSLVGPRPCLFNQEQLIAEREQRGVLKVKPGITGLAQINGIDMSDPEKLARWDAEMIETLSVGKYFNYLILTVLGAGTGDRTRT